MSIVVVRVRPSLLGFIIALVATGAAAPAQETRPRPATWLGAPTDRALDVLEAARRPTDEVLKNLAAREDLDPFLVANELLALELDARLAEPPRDVGAIAAAMAYARLAAAKPANVHLPRWVGTWPSLDGEALRREARLHEILARIVAAPDSTSETALSLADAAAGDIATAADSLSAVLIRQHAADAHSRAERVREALQIYQEIQPRLEKIGALFAAGQVLLEIGYAGFKAGDFDGAIEHSRRAREAFLAVGAKVPALNGLLVILMAEGQRGPAEDPVRGWNSLADEARACGHPPSLAIALANLGQVLLTADRLDEALACMNEADGILATLQDPRSRALNLGNMGAVHRRHGDHAKALECFRRDLEIVSEAGLNPGFALREIAHEEYWTDQYDAALETAKKALAAMVEAQNRLVATDVLELIGNIQLRLGRPLEALATLREVRKETVELQKSIASCTAGLATVHLHLGDYAEALTLAHDALDATSADEPGRQSEILVLLARIHATLGDGIKAAMLQRRALRIEESLGRKQLAAQVRSELAASLMGDHQDEEAEEVLDELIGNADDHADRWLVLAARVNLAEIWGRSGRTAEAQEALERLIAEARTGGAREIAVLARLALGKLLARQGAHDQAREHLVQAQADARAMASSLEATIGTQLASALLESGRTAEALIEAQAAVRASTVPMRGLNEVEAPWARESSRTAADIGLACATAALTGDPAERPGLIAEAFRFAELGRAQYLAQDLLNRAALVGALAKAPSVDAEAAARRRIDAAQRTIARLVAEGADELFLVRARTELDRASVLHEQAAARIRRESRRLADLVWPTPCRLDELQAALPPDTAFLTYHLAASRATAIVVTRKTAQVLLLPEGAGLQQRVENYVRYVSSAPENDETGPAAALYDALVRPVEGRLAGISRLVISPDGPLAFLPFDALLRTAEGQGERLIERFEVVYVPSATVWCALADDAKAAPPGEALLALGDPVYPGEGGMESQDAAARCDVELRDLGNLARLPATGEEVRAIAGFFPENHRNLLLREQATKSRIESAVARAPKRFAAVHFATHGHLDALHPRLTGLVLSAGEVLSLDDVCRLRIPSDLAVLSACASAHGAELPGEGIVGLVRCFLFGGCPRVVVSGWKVRDQDTRDFMIAFYSKIRKEGLAPGSALRAVKLERLRSGGPATHPHSWAAFAVWGRH